VREALGAEGDGDQLQELLRPALDGESTEFEWTGRRTGTHLTVQAVPVRDDRAGVIGVMAVCRDVTTRHDVEGALRSARPAPTGSPARSR
jgi:PAS domain S-box-containing protein